MSTQEVHDNDDFTTDDNDEDCKLDGDDQHTNEDFQTDGDDQNKITDGDDHIKITNWDDQNETTDGDDHIKINVKTESDKETLRPRLQNTILRQNNDKTNLRESDE